MKKVFSIFLAVILISQTFVNVGIGIYYHLNKTYIAQQLCENRNNPAIHCNGHCYLSKQLKKAEDREQKSSNILKEKEEIVSTEAFFTAYQIPPFNSGNTVSHTYAAAILPVNHAYSIIKPPETV